MQETIHSTLFKYLYKLLLNVFDSPLLYSLYLNSALKITVCEHKENAEHTIDWYNQSLFQLCLIITADVFYTSCLFDSQASKL